jgi:hypothetical protein
LETTYCTLGCTTTKKLVFSDRVLATCEDV